ncbi:unnamed protein product [Bursaphelenchus xylophilus]|uniref:(pine wood nematode) hypothetical protein n=1 Tax=Bursaphelenchus xylophilus TaxID=6326 RepID=A0A7I8WYC1_BURXY|nr:unnamed protein product [Bursaphelenchus xylophilus]CAG9101270.1 unnamed protein product [Bursaphelenchus xylophilus]
MIWVVLNAIRVLVVVACLAVDDVTGYASSADPRDGLKHDQVPQVRLTRDILGPGRYDIRVRPVQNHSRPLKIYISMSLYQLIDVNEPSQFIQMNMWMIQKWEDEMLDWDPRDYSMINTTILPHNVIWIPDTYLYNSVVMAADETERYMNIRADTLFWEGRRGSHISFLYPAIYTVTCRLNIRYFPYDQQNCTLTISSWTNSKSALDYYADPEVNMASFIPNEEWKVISFKVFRHEYKYACCPEPWVILEASIVIRRKPLYYVVNLIIPTSIITLVSITGFFTPASTADDRTEKINLGITTLLAMSILMLMISDQMPTTSDFIPLIAWFYLSIIIIISIGTFLTSVILSIQGRRQYGKVPPIYVRYWFFCKFTAWFCVGVPPPLAVLWEELHDHPYYTYNKRKKIISVPGALLPDRPPLNSYHSRQEKQLDSPGSPKLLAIPTPASTRSRKNWLRVGSAIQKHKATLDDKIVVPMIDISTPGSVSSSATNSRRASMWDQTVASVSVATGRLIGLADKDATARRTSAMIQADVMSMKRKRQCSLEWEFLATILDRIFLIFFILIVLITTLGMMMTGHLAQYQYDLEG